MPQKKLLKVVIKKSQWYRGRGVDSCLRMSKSSQQCCIGFLARQLGAKVKDIRGVANLDSLPLSDSNRLCCEFSDLYDNHLTIAYGVNDNPDITDTERIRELKALGREMGVQFVFQP